MQVQTLLYELLTQEHMALA